MGHNVGKQAALAVKKGTERQQEKETRTADQIMKGIRGNLAAHLAVTPSDVQFLLGQFDRAESQYQEAVKIITARNHEIVALREKLAEFRDVYEQENSRMKVTVEREMRTPGLDDQPLAAIPPTVAAALTSLED